jgi:hypothetical protein
VNLKRIEQYDATTNTRTNRKRLVSWNSTVDAVKQLLVLVLNCLSSDVAFGGGTRESAALNDDDMFGGGDVLVDIGALLHPLEDSLLEFLGVHGALLRSLDEQSGRRSAVPNGDALENEFSTSGADVVLDRPEVTNHKRL